MLPRDGSIFHIAGDDEAINGDEENSKSISDLEKKKSVGLQLLIDIPSCVLSIVTKSALGYSKDKSFEASGFLKFCFLCHKELRLKMDIFMYREQAFCSGECRDQKMMMDKRNELEISMVSNRDHLHYRHNKDSNFRGLTRRKRRLLVA